MKANVRGVIDTGVVVSAILLPRSVPRQAFDFVAEHGTILVSEATITELEEVLRRPKFNPYVPEPKRMEFLAALVRNAEVIEVLNAVTECRDPKDDKFLELAVSGNASHIISSDADLLVLHPFRGASILSPRDFVTWIESSQE
jgi:putative PIN family toxin of toxin-antitoxin system